MSDPDEQAAELLERLSRDSTGDLATYVEEIRLLTRLTELSDDSWQLLFRAGMQAALDRHEWLSAAELAHVALSRREAEGRMDAFLEEMEWAIAVAGRDADSMLYLVGLRAVVQLSVGDPQAAAESIVAARGYRTSRSARRAAAHFEMTQLVVSLRSLAPDVDDAEVHRFLESGADGALTGLVASAYIRYAVAVGRPAEARRWTPWLGERAAEGQRPWRAAEAQAYAAALRGDSSLRTLSNVNGRYYTAAWTLAASRLRLALLGGNRGRAVRGQGAISDLVGRVEPAVRDGAEGFTAITRAVLEGRAPLALGLPRHFSLYNLGSALAALEAVALAGSDEQVERWLEWYDATWPEHVVTSLEWRASAPRLRGLLLLRRGRLDEALECLDAAIERPVSAIEGDIAELQRFELTDPEHPRRAVIWERLAVAGVAPHLQAYAVLSALRRVERTSTPDREGASEIERRR